MPDPKGNVNQHLVSTLLQRRTSLKAERRQLRKAAERLGEIDEELKVVGEELEQRGHKDPPKPDPEDD